MSRRDDYEVEDGLLDDVDQKIKDLPQNDPMRLQLIMTRALISGQRRLKRNPMVKLGEFFEEHPALATVLTLIFYTLSIVIPSWLLQFLGIDPRVLGP